MPFSRQKLVSVSGNDDSNVMQKKLETEHVSID